MSIPITVAFAAAIGGAIALALLSISAAFVAVTAWRRAVACERAARREHDASERVEATAAAAAQAAADQTRQVIRRTGHDLRAGLTGIVGFAGLIESSSDVAKMQNWAKRVVEAGQDLEQRINTAVDTLGGSLSRVSAPLRALVPAELAQQAASAYDHTDAPCRVVLTIDDAAKTRYLGDQPQLATALDQLLAFAARRALDGIVTLRVNVLGQATTLSDRVGFTLGYLDDPNGPDATAATPSEEAHIRGASTALSDQLVPATGGTIDQLHRPDGTATILFAVELYRLD